MVPCSVCRTPARAELEGSECSMVNFICAKVCNQSDACLYLCMLGTLINAGTVIVGSSVGLLLRDRMPEKLTKAVFGALGLFTLYIGVSMGFESKQPLVLVFSLLIGVIVGTFIDFDARASKLIERLQKKKGKASTEATKRFTDGLLTAFVLFCVGAMTLLGCLREGLTGNRDIILTKAFMDLFSSVALASAFGRGVLFSVIPLVIYQGGITLLATQLAGVLTDEVIAEMIGTGGLMLIGLGLNILKVTDLKLMNFIPALLIAPLLTHFGAFEWLEEIVK